MVVPELPGCASALVNQLAQIYVAPGTILFPMDRHRDILPALLLNVFMGLDDGVGDIESALTIDQHKTSADFSVNIVIVIFEHLLLRACISLLLLYACYSS